ncbi:MAG: phage integrase SAM-like domain-containing protein [Janthinobacterium lividum]
MEVTRQLRLDALNKHGLAPIQLTLCWAGHRLRLGSGQRCLPKHWDERRQHVKDKPDSYAESVNQVLDDYTTVAAAAERAALELGQVLGPTQLKADVERRYAALLAGRAGRLELPPTLAAPLTFFDHFDRWIEKEKQKISVRTGRKLSKDTIWTHQAVRDEVRDFGTATKQIITFEGLNQDFYDGLRNYMLGTKGRSPRTFNTYIKRLRSFLFWAEGQGLPVPARISKVLRLAQSYVGVEALTQAELLRIAALDFSAPTVQAYLASTFPEPPAKAAGSGGRNALTSADHAQRTEWTRDTFLLCAYTSLRHADAQELGWQHVFPEQELIKKLLNKTNITALIPYLDDDVFRPVALLESYHELGGATCLPFVRDPWQYLPHVAALARITRLKLGMHVGRKTYATLKVYQGVPKTLVMLATGHQTEKQFNEYLGINEEELIASHRQTARRLPPKAQSA